MPELDFAKKNIKILFVVDDLQGHGVTTSLINLLNAIDVEKFDISLLVFNNQDSAAEGDIPFEIKRISYDNGIELFFQTWKKSIWGLLKLRRWKLLYYRVKVFMDAHRYGAVKALQKNWEKIVQSLPYAPGCYDVVIGFQDYFSGVFSLEKVNAQKFVGWNHNIYQEMGYDDSLTKEYYNKLDLLCTISEATRDSLLHVFGERLDSKITVVPNAINSKKIDALSKEQPNDAFFHTDKEKILSIGRLVEQKGFDFAIKVGTKLKQDGVSFMWYILGEGKEREHLEKLIDEENLNGSVVLCGFAENPYPFMKDCDVYVQPSRYEGFGIAISEAYYLGSPLVITPDAGRRYCQSDSIRIIPYGDENQWAAAIEDILNKKTKQEIGQKKANNLTVSAFYKIFLRLMN